MEKLEYLQKLERLYVRARNRKKYLIVLLLL
jgi:hypothetical protein